MADTKKTGKVQPIAADNPAEQTIPPPPSGRGRPPGRKDPVPKQMSFFDRLAKIDKQDWGTRAQVRVYRLEPIIDRLRGSERKYIRVYQEPLTEEQLKVDNGSGRYRLYLNYKAAAGPEQEIDSVEIDILDMKFPPQIPLGEWVDDPRNKRWGWAKAIIQQQAPQPPQPAAVLENAYETVLGIQDRERDRMGEKTSSAQEFAALLGAVKTLLPPAAPSTDNAMLNTVVTLLTAQINASQNEAQQLRSQIFDLIKARSAEPKDTNSIEALLDKADTLLPKLKSLLNLGGEKLTDVVHGRPRPWWQELLLEAVPPVVQNAAPMIPIVLSRIGQQPQNGTPQAAPRPQNPAQLPPGAPAQPSPQQQVELRVNQFLGSNLRPMQMYFEKAQAHAPRDPEDPQEGVHDGSDFADWIFQFHGEQILKDARSLGSGTIMQMFRQSPFWQAIKQHEAQLEVFIDQVLQYQPPPPEEDGEAEDLREAATV